VVNHANREHLESGVAVTKERRAFLAPEVSVRGSSDGAQPCDLVFCFGQKPVVGMREAAVMSGP
jgi:hypothetical protein